MSQLEASDGLEKAQRPVNEKMNQLTSNSVFNKGKRETVRSCCPKRPKVDEAIKSAQPL